MKLEKPKKAVTAMLNSYVDPLLYDGLGWTAQKLGEGVGLCSLLLLSVSFNRVVPHSPTV